MAQTSFAGQSISSQLNLTLIRLEFARMDLFVARQVQRWRSAGQDFEDVYRGLYISEQEVDDLLARPLAAGWGQWHPEPDENTVDFNRELKHIEKSIHQVETQAENNNCLLRLRHLERVFGLDSFERDVFLVALAPLIDLRYERLFGYLQDDVTRRRPTLNLILNLLCQPGVERFQKFSYFLNSAPLFRNDLLRWTKESFEKEGLLNRPLSVDESVYLWLVGQYQPSRQLAHLMARIDPGRVVEDWALPENLLDGLSMAEKDTPVVVFTGSDEGQKQLAMSAIASHFNHPVYCVDVSRLDESEISIIQALRELMRDCLLNQAIPVVSGWESCLEDNHPKAEILNEVLTYPGLIILSGKRGWSPGGIYRERNFAWFEFSIPDYFTRLRFWKAFVNDESLSAEPDFAILAGQFLLSSGQIRDAVASARDAAFQRGEPLSLRSLFAAAREHSNPRLAGLARKIRTEFDWNDLILPDDLLTLLREILNTIKTRPLVLDEWGLGKKIAPNRGVTILFAGPPGTGKTMSAGILARELGLDLYKIDLSTVVSKYIGETEKNLERIFIEAETSNSILFFDEADALFGKRSEVKDAHDRYANIEISFLLQRMEAYNGVTILATNMRANLDEAFTRRLQFAVDFPFPDEPYRLLIWKSIFPPDIPRSDDIDFPLLAKRFRLAGGNIRNIIVNAAYLAAADGGCVHMSHILHGTRRELQKMGRLTSDIDFI